MKVSKKEYVLIAVLLVVNFVFSGCKKLGLGDRKDKVSYSIGWDIGTNFRKAYVDVNPDAFLIGFKDAIKGAEPIITESEMQEVLMSYQQELRQKQRDERDKIAQKNRKEGEEFLAENKKKEGVKTTKSGLQYRIIKEGNGKRPGPKDTVTVHYRGTLINGKEFDSSYKRNQPATFPLDGVIKGWTEGLQLMKEGSIYEFFIPSELAYGEAGAGPNSDIGPNSVLIFTVELIKVGK